MGYSIEVIMRVYDDSNGGYFQISQDPDGLDLVKLAACDSVYGEVSSFTMKLECARKFHQALGEYVIRESGRQVEKDDADTSSERISGDY